MIGSPLDTVTSGNLPHCFLAMKEGQPILANTRLHIHALGNFNNVLGKHRPNQDSKMLNSLMRAIELW